MTNRLAKKTAISLLAAFLLPVVLAISVNAQQTENQSTPSYVYLSFRYYDIIDTDIPTYYKNNQFYLPVGELFDKLKIFNKREADTKIIIGIFNDDKYTFNFTEQFAQINDTKIALHRDDYLLRNKGYFVKPEILAKVFGLKFTADINSLTLDLTTKQTLPVVRRHRQKLERKGVENKQPYNEQDYYPLKYGRDYAVLNGGFLDYHISGIYTRDYQLFTFNNSLGVELLAGDVNGNLYGTISGKRQAFTTGGLRWRYVDRRNEYFSTLMVGQMFNNGIRPRGITGFKISNTPIEPRNRFNKYVIDGEAPPQSNIELYLNNRLIDYQKVDQSGQYQFRIPLNYGNNNYSIRIYKPNGITEVQRKRIRIPFKYVPPGEVDYSVSGGRMQNPILGSTKRGYSASASVSTGLTDWLTGEVSTEYLSEYHNRLPSLTGSLHARLFTNYLISANINTANFYRLTSSVIYRSGANWSISYDYNPGNSRLYNIGGNKHQAKVSFFTPLTVGKVPLNLRMSTTYHGNEGTGFLRYRTGLSTYLGRMNIRLRYQDQQFGPFLFKPTSSSQLTNSYSYSLRRRNAPSFLKGLYLNGSITYLPKFKRFEDAEIEVSRGLLDIGEIRLSYNRNFLRDFNSLSLDLSFDFGSTRSRTTTRYNRGKIMASQSFRGSVGYDPEAKQALLSNRQQVGQAGTSVRLFVDQNNDGSYQKNIDDIIDEPAVSVERAGGRNLLKNGVNYVTQLQPYYRYNLEIIREGLENPLLSPATQKFSIVTDPNQYKTIDIPFYMSGVVSGKVLQKVDSLRKGMGGISVYLKSAYTDSTREPYYEKLRTFSNGSFYTHKVPPGNYDLYIDNSQLEILNSVSRPDTINIKLEELAKGDFVENLKFTLVSKSDTTKTHQEPVTEATTDRKLYYKIQLASFGTLEKAKQVAMQATKQLGGTYSVIKNINNGLYAIRSIPIPQKKRAVENIISYHNSAYESAALVVLQSDVKDSLAAQAKYVQIGAFKYKASARMFANRSARQLERETALTYNTKQKLYKVYLDKKLSTLKERREMLSSVQNKTSFRDTFINAEGYIQLGAFEHFENAERFTNLIEITVSYPTKIAHDPESGLYEVYLNRNFSTDEAKKEMLQQIRNKGSVFEGAFISNYPVSSPNGLENERKMTFQFQVQLNGNNLENTADKMETIKKEFPRIKVSELPEGAILFDEISSWSKTKRLYKRLSELFDAQPIKILIEESESSR